MTHTRLFVTSATLTWSLLGAAGCDSATDSGVQDGFEVEASLVDAAPTVVLVRWTTDDPVRGQVRFGETEAYGWETPLEDQESTEHSALLLGMPHSTEVHFVVVSHSASEETVSEDRDIVTGGVPSTLPSLTVELGERSPAAFTALPVIADMGDDELQAVALVDDRGRWVWATELDPGYQSLRVRLARDGSGVVYNALAADKESDLPSKLIQVGWDGERVLELDAPEMHHDFVQLPDGGFAYLATEPRLVGDVYMGSDVIVELDGRGGSRDAWVLWDHLEQDFAQVLDPEQLDPRESLGHANSLQLLEEQDAWLVDFANLSAVAQIDRASGDVSWILGSEGDTFDASPDPIPPFRGHEVVIEGDTLWIYVNDSGGDECSRLWKIGLDIEASQATLLGDYHWDPCQYTYAMGGVNRIDPEHTLVVWSLSGRLEALDAELEPVWALQASLGAGFGYSAVADGLYPVE